MISWLFSIIVVKLFLGAVFSGMAVYLIMED